MKWLVLMVLIACNGGGGGSKSASDESGFTVDENVTAYNWRRPSGTLNGRQMFETVEVRADHAFIIHYNLDGNGDLLDTQDMTNYFIEITGNNQIEFTDQNNASNQIVMEFSDYGVNQMEICINSDCNIYDRLAIGDL